MTDDMIEVVINTEVDMSESYDRFVCVTVVTFVLNEKLEIVESYCYAEDQDGGEVEMPFGYEELPNADQLEAELRQQLQLISD